MTSLRVRLFGKLSVYAGERELAGFSGVGKAQELFFWLLLHRDRPHTREALADTLWGESAGAQPKKNLRQALWQLQSALSAEGQTTPRLDAGPDRIQLSLQRGLWLDVAELEQAHAAAEGTSGRDLDSDRAAKLAAAVNLYRGDLLEGWYRDWCILERERLQAMYLAMLDKLTAYAEASGDYEAGLAHGSRILRVDRARERTHRAMMRLHFLSGDRTAALRQYEQCTIALAEELGVKPARGTQLLLEQVRHDSLGDEPTAPERSAPATAPLQHAPLGEALGRLKQLQASLLAIGQQLQQEIESVELALNRRR